MPESLAPHFAVIIGVISMPASLLFDPDSFYFAVLPVLAQAADAVGLAGVDLGRAAIAGEMTLGFPISPLTPATFLLIGLTGIDLGEHQNIPFCGHGLYRWSFSLRQLLSGPFLYKRTKMINIENHKSSNMVVFISCWIFYKIEPLLRERYF